MWHLLQWVTVLYVAIYPLQCAPIHASLEAAQYAGEIVNDNQQGVNTIVLGQASETGIDMSEMSLVSWGLSCGERPVRR